MTPPILPFGSTTHVEAANEAGLVHTASQWFQNGVRQPNGEYPGVRSLGKPIRCLYKGINSAQAQIAAARGIEATGTLKVTRGQVMPSSSKWQIDTECEDGVFAVEVTGDLVRVGTTMRLVAVKDTTLNRK